MNFDNFVDETFNGCISIVSNNEIIFRKAYGYADLANKRKNEIDTKFATASAGKAFVAVAILQLIEQGRLNFDDCIGEILTFDLKNIDKKITIRQLLNHTSGIPDYFDESVMSEYEELWRDYPNYKIRSTADLIPLFINKPMMYPSGERFKYNNTGYAVLGLIIEKVVNLPFDQYLNKIIFEPCHMMNTGYYELDRLPSNCANGYLYDESRKEYYTNIYSIDVKGTGAGGAYTTVNDVDLFWEYLLEGKLLSKEMVHVMLSPQAYSEKACYGYGVWLAKTSDETFLPYFQGMDPGVSFISFFNRDKNVRITIVSNFANNVWSICRKIRQELNLI